MFLLNYGEVKHEIVWKGSIDGILPILPKKLRCKRRNRRSALYFCPFHFVDGREERRASFFWVHSDYWIGDAQGTCLGCGREALDLIGFFAAMNDVSYFQALIRLAKFYRIPLKWGKKKKE